MEEAKQAAKMKGRAVPIRPPQKFFNYREVEGAQLKYTNNFEKRMYYWSRNYYRRGFLYKYFNFKVLEFEGVVPPRDIFNTFLRPDDDDDSQASESEDPDEEIEKWKKLAAENLSLTKGDKIKVVNGDLKNLIGSVVSVEKSIVKMQPDHEAIKQMLDLDIKMIAKYFEPGDHIYVVEGEHEGEKGLITKTDGNKCIVFSDIRKREFRTLSNYLKLSSQVSECVTTNIEHDYAVYDLVLTNKRTVGVVLAIEKDSIKIINESSEIEHVEVINVSNKVIQKNNISTLDHNSNFISIGDTAKVGDGNNKGVKGVIKYIYQNSVFLYTSLDSLFSETLGVFVENNRNLSIMGDDTNNRGMAAPPNKKRNPLINKVAFICRGEFKGFEGKVVDATDDIIRLQIFSKSKIVSLKVTDIIEKDKIKDEPDMSSSIKSEISHDAVPKTPAYYPNSPGWALKTPANESPDWKAESPEYE